MFSLVFAASAASESVDVGSLLELLHPELPIVCVAHLISQRAAAAADEVKGVFSNTELQRSPGS